MIQKSDEMSKENKITTAILLVVIALITFYPLLPVGFTTDDDTKGAIQAAMSFKDKLNLMVSAAKNTGRISFIVNFPLAHLPYAFDSFVYYKIVALGSVIMNILIFGYVLKRIFNSLILSLTAVAFFLCFLQLSWQYNLITSYPFAFHLGLSMFFLSALFLDTYIRTSEKKYQLFSALLFIIPLIIYEAFILYIVFLVLIIYFRAPYKEKKKAEILYDLLKQLRPHLIVAGLYVACYFSFKYYYADLTASAAGMTDGYKIVNFSVINAVKVIYQLSISSFPTYLFWHNGDLFRTYSDMFSGNQYNFFTIIKNARVEWIVKSILSAYLVYIVLKFHKTNFNFSQFILMVLISILLLFIPELPLSATSKYQDWVTKYGGLEYTVTYFSLFGTVLLFASITLYGMQILSSKSIAARMYLSVVLVLIASVSFITDYSNSYVAKSQYLSQLKWNTFDLFMRSSVFKNIPDESIIYAPTLWGDIGYPDAYWGEYVRAKTGKKINIIKTRDAFQDALRHGNGANEEVFVLKYMQEAKDSNQFIIFAPVINIIEADNRDYIISDTAHVYYYSKYKRFLIHMNLINNHDDYNVYLNGHLLGVYDNNVLSLVVNEDHNIDKQSPLFHTVITYKYIDISSVSISSFLDYYPPADKKYFAGVRHERPIKVGFAGGFSELEKNDEGEWRWCGKEGALVLKNDSPKDQVVLLSMGLATGYKQASDIVISRTTFRDSLKINSDVSLYKRQITVPKKSKVEIRFSCDAPRVNAANDPRSLVFRVNNMRIKQHDPQFLSVYEEGR